MEEGVLVSGHPAFADLVDGRPFVGQVPVAGRSRLAYLMPVVDVDQQIAGALAVDVGWIDDLQRVDRDARRDVAISTVILLAVLTVAVVIAMTLTFRPLKRLSGLARRIGAGEMPASIPFTRRRDEIGRLANGLSAVHQLQIELSDLAYHDQLTGLANRPAFLAELNRRLDAIGSEPDAGFALILMDVDQFKEVNDVLGHAAGDELLVELSTALQQTCVPGEFVARLGGDEFALLTLPLSTRAAAVEVADRLGAAIERAAARSSVDVAVTCSSGIVLIPRQADTAGLALSHADMALYRSKRNGRAQWQFYESSLSTTAQRHLQISTELRKAIDEGHIALEYQPLVGTADNDLVGFEALARWTHPDQGDIPPDEFVSVAETSGLIDELGRHVLEQTCEQVRTWLDADLTVPPISVNVSAVQLWQDDFAEQVRAILGANDLDPSALTLEITESMLVHKADRRIRQPLEELSAFGVRLSIDDFGTGYSSLSYLHELPVDQLKIDRSFIDRVERDHGRQQLFHGIASLGRTMGLEVVAEGIETEAELTIARQAGCAVVQGFLLGKPMGADTARRWMIGVDSMRVPTTV